MKIAVPNKPSGTSHFILFCIAVWEYLFNGNFPFIDSDTVKVERGPNGYSFRANPPGAAGGKGKTIDANYKLMVITALGSSLTPAIPDLLICSSATASSNPPGVAADTVYVAKARQMRRIPKEFFLDNGANVTQNYTYFGPASSDSGYGDNFRTATDGINTELESVTPRYATKSVLTANNVTIEQSLIYVVDLGSPTGVTDPAGNAVTRIEVLPARMWSKVVSS